MIEAAAKAVSRKEKERKKRPRTKSVGGLQQRERPFVHVGPIARPNED